MNPPLTKAQREARGTMRPDRDYGPDPEERDPDEKKPRRPSELEGHGAKFWKKHSTPLWDSGWLRRDNVDVFTELCKEWNEMRDLEDWFAGIDTDGFPRGRFMLERGQFVVKEVERPQSKLYEKLRASVFKKCASIGIISDKPAKLERPKKKDPNAKPSIGEFERNGPQGIAK